MSSDLSVPLAVPLEQGARQTFLGYLDLTRERKKRGEVKAAIFNEARSISIDERLDPIIKEPTGEIVRVVLVGVCGLDPSFYR